MLSPWVQREVLRGGRGMNREAPIMLPKQVTNEVLELVLSYCCFHRAPGRSDKVTARAECAGVPFWSSVCGSAELM